MILNTAPATLPTHNNCARGMLHPEHGGDPGTETHAIAANRADLRRSGPTCGRLRFVRSIWLTAVLAGVTAQAGYPDRIIRIIVPFPPGGGTDIVTRRLGEAMASGSRPGRDHREQARRRHDHRHQRGRDQRARRLHAADGDLRPCGQSEPQRQAAVRHVCGRSRRSRWSRVRSTSWWSTQNSRSTIIRDLIAAAKAKPGTINFGSYGLGTSAHLAGELFKVAGRRRSDARALQGRGACDHRSPGRPDRGHVHDRRQRRPPTCRAASCARSP